MPAVGGGTDGDSGAGCDLLLGLRTSGRVRGAWAAAPWPPRVGPRCSRTAAGLRRGHNTAPGLPVKFGGRWRGGGARLEGWARRPSGCAGCLLGRLRNSGTTLLQGLAERRSLPRRPAFECTVSCAWAPPITPHAVSHLRTAIRRSTACSSRHQASGRRASHRAAVGRAAMLRAATPNLFVEV